MPKIRGKPTEKQVVLLKKIRRSTARMRRAQRAAQLERIALYTSLCQARALEIGIEKLAQATGWTGPRITQITREAKSA